MAKTRAAYPAEFRRQMVELVHAGRMPEELAHEFEPTAQSIRNWVTQRERNAGRGNGGLTTASGSSSADCGVVPRHSEFPGSALRINNFRFGGVQLQPYSLTDRRPINATLVSLDSLGSVAAESVSIGMVR